MEIVLLFVVLLGLVLALVTSSTRPVSIAAAMFLGWLLWPPLFTGVVAMFNQITVLEFGPISTKEGRDGAFIAVTWGLMIVLYLGLPLIAAIVDPVRRYVIDKKSVGADVKGGIGTGVAAVVAGLGSVDVSGLYGRGSGGNQGQGDAYASPYPGGPGGGPSGETEGQWTEVESPLLQPPQALLPAPPPEGEEPPEGDEGFGPDEPSDDGQPPGSQPGIVPELEEEAEGPPGPPGIYYDFGEVENEESSDSPPEHETGLVPEYDGSPLSVGADFVQMDEIDAADGETFEPMAGALPETDDEAMGLVRRGLEVPDRFMAANFELQGEIADELGLEPVANVLRFAAEKQRTSHLPERKEGDTLPQGDTPEERSRPPKRPKRKHSRSLPELEVTDD